jgi:hypothetical protein
MKWEWEGVDSYKINKPNNKKKYVLYVCGCPPPPA